MDAAGECAKEFYDSCQSMRASIIARAVFENAPLDALYYYQLYEETGRAIAAYKSTGNEEIRDAIDRRIFASMRNVEALLAQGDARRLRGGGFELEMRAIDGVSYSVRAWDDKRQTRRLHVSVPLARQGGHYTCGDATLPRLTGEQIQSLRYRFTTDGGKTFAEVKARLRRHRQDGITADFDDICKFPLIGRLEGSLRFGTARPAKRKSAGGGYTFVIPDRQELLSVLENRCGLAST